MIDYQALLQQIANSKLHKFTQAWQAAIEQRLAQRSHGDLAQMQAAIAALPHYPDISYTIDDTITIKCKQAINKQQLSDIRQNLLALKPWRKGPFNLFGIDVDAEWRSAIKWQAIIPHLAPLQDRIVLDVGANNGYYSWR